MAKSGRLVQVEDSQSSKSIVEHPNSSIVELLPIAEEEMVETTVEPEPIYVEMMAETTEGPEPSVNIDETVVMVSMSEP